MASMLCGGVRVASGDWDLVDDTIVVLRCGGGGWPGVDLVGDGELEGMVLGEALGYIETANGFRKRWPCECFRQHQRGARGWSPHNTNMALCGSRCHTFDLPLCNPTPLRSPRPFVIT